MKRVERPKKRVRVKRERKVHRNKLQRCRLFRVYPDPSKPWWIVEVRIARNNLRMREAINFFCGERAAAQFCRRTDGCVRSWVGKARARGVVARMYLNVEALRRRPNEVVAHECTHAGMAWARLRRANLRVMPGEEVLCYAVGRLVKQVNRVCFATGVWP